MNLILILFRPFNIQWRESVFCDFVKENNNKKYIGLYSDIYRVISFKLGVMVGTTMLYILISVWMTMAVIKSHSCMKNGKL